MTTISVVNTYPSTATVTSDDGSETVTIVSGSSASITSGSNISYTYADGNSGTLPLNDHATLFLDYYGGGYAIRGDLQNAIPKDENSSSLIPDTTVTGDWTLHDGDVITLWNTSNDCDVSITSSGDSYYFCNQPGVVDKPAGAFLPVFLQVVTSPTVSSGNFGGPLSNGYIGDAIAPGDKFYLRIFLATSSGTAAENSNNDTAFDTYWYDIHGNYITYDSGYYYVKYETGPTGAVQFTYSYANQATNVTAGTATGLQHQGMAFKLHDVSSSASPIEIQSYNDDGTYYLVNKAEFDSGDDIGATAFLSYPWLTQRPSNIAARTVTDIIDGTGQKTYGIQSGTGFLNISSSKFAWMGGSASTFTHLAFQTDTLQGYSNVTYGVPFQITVEDSGADQTYNGYCMLPTVAKDYRVGTIVFSEDTGSTCPTNPFMVVPAYKSLNGWGGKIRYDESVFLGDSVSSGFNGDNFLWFVTTVVPSAFYPCSMYVYEGTGFAGTNWDSNLSFSYHEGPDTTGVGMDQFAFYDSTITAWDRFIKFINNMAWYFKALIAIAIIIFIFVIIGMVARAVANVAA